MSRIVAAVFLDTILVPLAIGALAPATWQAAVAHDGPGCPFKGVTGVDCPFCGMTRATLAMGHGDFRDAFSLHPFAPFVLLGFIAVLAVIVAGRTGLLLRGKTPYIILGAILALWVARLLIQW